MTVWLRLESTDVYIKCFEQPQDSVSIMFSISCCSIHILSDPCVVSFGIGQLKLNLYTYCSWHLTPSLRILLLSFDSEKSLRSWRVVTCPQGGFIVLYHHQHCLYTPFFLLFANCWKSVETFHYFIDYHVSCYHVRLTSVLRFRNCESFGRWFIKALEKTFPL